MAKPDLQSGPRSVRFAVFEVNFVGKELFKHGTRLRVQRQPFEILCQLVKRPGEIVLREELQDLLWPGETFVEYEDSLNTAVRKLRAALSDSSETPRYIETVSGRGYRFIAPLIRSEDSDDLRRSLNESAERARYIEAFPNLGFGNAAPEEVQPETVAESPQAISANSCVITGAATSAQTLANPKIQPQINPRKEVYSRWLVVGAVACLVLALSYFWWSDWRPRSRIVAGRRMLAVLPFENLTGDSSQNYLSDGLTEEMIAQLGRLDPASLGVIGRTSVMHYRHTQAPLDQIARELGVQYCLEGSVRRDADKLRITAQLIQMNDQTNLWSREYDRQLSGLLDVQGEIAAHVAREIQLTLNSEQNAAASGHRVELSPAAYEAYDLYLQGRFYWNKRNKEGFEKAVQTFQQSIEKDPNYARAYAGLADAQALLGTYGYAPMLDMMPKARSAALKALQLDEGLAEAHASLALITEFYDWDWKTAEKEFRRAIALDPNYATAHHWYSEYLGFQGRFDEALAESETARGLDPLSMIIAADRGEILYYSRQYDRSIAQFTFVTTLDPGVGRANEIVEAYVQERRYNEAFSHIERWRRRIPGDAAWTWAYEAYVAGRAGDRKRLDRAFAQMERLKSIWNLDPAPLVVRVYLGSQQYDKAYESLEAAYREHSNLLATLKVDPIYDPLRGDPRFRDLLYRVGLQ